MKKMLLWTTLLLILLTSVQLWINRDRTGQKAEFDQVPGQGEALIGGNFTLTDQNGKTVHESDFHGRVMLVFFGFTHCPDICPVSVATLSKTMQLLGDKADGAVAVFITVDPARDTPAVLKDYLANFDKHIVGLTGTEEQIKTAAEAYKAYFSKRNIPWSQESPDEDHDHGDHEAHEAPEHHHEGNKDNYNVDHSGYIYMMAKDGKYIRLFEYNASADEIAASVQRHL